MKYKKFSEFLDFNLQILNNKNNQFRENHMGARHNNQLEWDFNNGLKQFVQKLEKI